MPQPYDETGDRRRHGRTGSRPLAVDEVDFTARNVVQRHFAVFEHQRAIVPRCDE
ncbi:hypothetical protein [Herbiconiux sp. YIM B11900]|uniref:hypothetical protein n=1 Tax=Herbiconiux sp. YIM B11900 TaxID=3404131 RepID=UPI003F84380B